MSKSKQHVTYPPNYNLLMPKITILPQAAPKFNSRREQGSTAINILVTLKSQQSHCPTQVYLRCAKVAHSHTIQTLNTLPHPAPRCDKGPVTSPAANGDVPAFVLIMGKSKSPEVHNVTDLCTHC